MAAHYVYRVFDRDGRLIYVGCTKNLFGRLRSHEINSWWAYQAARVTSKVYPDKRSGRDAECAAIRSERPRWNLFGRGSREMWTADEYADYVIACLNLSEPMTPYRLTRLQNLARHYRNRFGRELPVPIPESAA
ncbi:G-I-Y Y-I-G endonuclease [Mycobacterium phage LilSpotty]|uniref:G-I-Y Y-I-G endonuclease n=1 Tax=Mycobacterium phage LilSpotty TaxID=2588512 RepID=A0A4Y6ENZ1_9CAUD|nr:G-I-Y Y-I-G endonuclease [Mycobacterium phage LilSpotty]QDF19777.1 G-I-Y Y-I-G endonuclease [Mycobacterium phage LilSpotty]